MAPEACAAWRADLASAAIGRLEPAERTRLLAHLDGCGSCRATLAELEQTAGLVRLADAARVAGDDEPAPAPSLGDAIVARLRTEHEHARRRTRRRVRRVVVAAVAAAVLAVAIGAGRLGRDGRGAPARQVALVSSRAQVRATARLVEDDSGTEVRLTGAGLDPRDVYWLWLTGPDGRRVGAGTFNGGRRGAFDVATYSALPYALVRRVWVTDASDRVVLDARVAPA